MSRIEKTLCGVGYDDIEDQHLYILGIMPISMTLIALLFPRWSPVIIFLSCILLAFPFGSVFLSVLSSYFFADVILGLRIIVPSLTKNPVIIGLILNKAPLILPLAQAIRVASIVFCVVLVLSGLSERGIILSMYIGVAILYTNLIGYVLDMLCNSLQGFSVLWFSEVYWSKTPYTGDWIMAVSILGTLLVLLLISLLVQRKRNVSLRGSALLLILISSIGIVLFYVSRNLIIYFGRLSTIRFPVESIVRDGALVYLLASILVLGQLRKQFVKHGSFLINFLTIVLYALFIFKDRLSAIVEQFGISISLFNLFVYAFDLCVYTFVLIIVLVPKNQIAVREYRSLSLKGITLYLLTLCVVTLSAVIGIVLILLFLLVSFLSGLERTEEEKEKDW